MPRAALMANQTEASKGWNLHLRGCVGRMVRITAILVLGLAGCSKGVQISPPYEGVQLEGTATEFRLVDQKGMEVALSDFRGKVVALAFLDPKCTDVCPLTAAQFRAAAEGLGGLAADVVFLAVNVNVQANSRADVEAATVKWGVDKLESWHFLTAGEDVLHQVWKAYGVAAEGTKPGKPEEVPHTAGVFLIDQAGRRSWYISIPLDDSAWRGPSLSDLLQKHVRELLKAKA